MTTRPCHKRQLGQYYTQGNPFGHPAFLAWAQTADLAQTVVLEPFAGANGLIDMLQSAHLCHQWASFDIHPGAPGVQQRDTLQNFPTGYRAAVTNPPYLAKNSAKRRGLPFPDTDYDDLYKHALAITLTHTPWVAAIVPDSLFTANLFHERAQAFVSLTQSMFADTEHPVCLALFGPTGGNPELWMGNTRVGTMQGLAPYRPYSNQRKKWRFNDPQGLIGLHALDTPKGPTVQFIPGLKIDSRIIKHSSRAITRISSPDISPSDLPALLASANTILHQFRTHTQDVFLTSFKGLRMDGLYRRRLDFATARTILDQAHEQNTPLSGL